MNRPGKQPCDLSCVTGCSPGRPWEGEQPREEATLREPDSDMESWVKPAQSALWMRGGLESGALTFLDPWVLSAMLAGSQWAGLSPETEWALPCELCGWRSTTPHSPFQVLA